MVAWHSRGIGIAGQVSANAASEVVLGTNRVVLGHRPKRTAKEGGVIEVELVDAAEEETTGEAKDVTMTEIATTAATDTGTETEMGALATTD